MNHGRSIDSFVNMVAEDKENNLWIGTHNGLYVLHKETDEIEKIISPLLQVSNVESILYASNGDLWVEATRDCFAEKPATVLSIVKKHGYKVCCRRPERSNMDWYLGTGAAAL